MQGKGTATTCEANETEYTVTYTFHTRKDDTNYENMSFGEKGIGSRERARMWGGMGLLLDNLRVSDERDGLCLEFERGRGGGGCGICGGNIGDCGNIFC